MSGRRGWGRGAAAIAFGLPAVAWASDAPDRPRPSNASMEPPLRRLYHRFLAAQNALDLAAVRRVLWDSPDFLWVSDGRAYWGPDALVERMQGFQTAETWRVEPELDQARAVALDERHGYLSLTLTLVIGPRAAPDRLRFLVHMLGRRASPAPREDWRIAALFTTEDKSA